MVSDSDLGMLRILQIEVSPEVRETSLLSLESYSQKEAIMITNSRVSLVTPIRGDEADLCTAGI